MNKPQNQRFKFMLLVFPCCRIVFVDWLHQSRFQRMVGQPTCLWQIWGESEFEYKWIISESACISFWLDNATENSDYVRKIDFAFSLYTYLALKYFYLFFSSRVPLQIFLLGTTWTRCVDNRVSIRVAPEILWYSIEKICIWMSAGGRTFSYYSSCQHGFRKEHFLPMKWIFFFA